MIDPFTRTDFADTKAGAPRLARLGDLLGDFEAESRLAHEAYTSGQPQGPVSGFQKLDTELGGRFQPGIHVIHGGPGVGKTAFLLQLGAAGPSPCLLVSCEMAPVELLRRIIARSTATFLGKLKSGELSPAEAMALARRTVANCPHLYLADATRAHATPAWIRTAARVAQGDAPHLAIAIDSIHSWAEGGADGVAEYDILNSALSALRQLASELSCPVVVTAERNRAAMATGGLHAGAGSRKIEYSGESVLDLSRADENAAPDVSGEVDVVVKIVKNRNGSPGTKIPLKFSGRLQRFREC